MGRKQVKRHTKNYQFRDENPSDQHVYSILEYWKGDRREVTTLRKAVALYHALEQGDFGALLEHFPQYKGQVSGGGGGGFDTDKLATEIAERVVMLNGSQYQMSPPPPTPPSNQVIGAGKMVQAPTFEDDDEPPPTMVIKKSADVSSSARFLEALQSLH